MTDYQEIIDKEYPVGSRRRDIYLRHCRAVADEALRLNALQPHPLPAAMVEGAAMLHDIGIAGTDAPDIDCHGSEPYIRHGLIGGAMLRREGYPEEWARVAERHTGAGITSADIAAQRLPLPDDVVMVPCTLLERLVCYADKFYSKSGDMKRKSLDRVIASMARHGDGTLRRFMELHKQFCLT